MWGTPLCTPDGEIATVPDRPASSLIEIASVPNLRDVGGHRAADGRLVRRQLLFRSTELSKLQGADLDRFAALGIRSVYDLRTEAERVAQPDRLPPGTDLVALDVLRARTGAAPVLLLQLLSDPRAAAEVFGGGKAVTLFEQAYRGIVSLPSALDGYRRLFSDIADPGKRPALVHCTTGKDRTGWAAAALLLLLGVADDDVMDDFLLSGCYLLAAYQPVLDRFRALGGDPEMLTPVIGVRPQYLEAALDEVRTRYGTIEGYFGVGLGLDATVVEAPRTAFLETA